jgi:cytochrome P450
MQVQTALWLGRPIGFMEWCARRYGDCFTLRLALSPVIVMVNDPAKIARIVSAPAASATGGEENSVLEPLLGPRSVLMLDGPEHLRQRKLLISSFVGERMRRHQATIAEITRREVAGWPSGTPFPLLERTRAITMEVILRIVFGLEDPARLSHLRGLVTRLLGTGGTLLIFPWARRDLGPRSPWGRFLRARAEVDRVLMAEIARRRAAPAGDDALGQMLLARDDDGRGLTDMEVRDELMTLLVAGHETTATTLAWCFELLLRNPEVLRRLEDELSRGSELLLEGVLRETLRLRAPFRLFSRRLKEPMEVGRWLLPAGVALAGNIYLTHRNGATYEDPNAFRPERYTERPPSGTAWVPFGGGYRRCLGASFATFEMATIVRTVLAGTQLRPADRRPEPVSLHAVILVPRHGVQVLSSPRSGA